MVCLKRMSVATFTTIKTKTQFQDLNLQQSWNLSKTSLVSNRLSLFKTFVFIIPYTGSFGTSLESTSSLKFWKKSNGNLSSSASAWIGDSPAQPVRTSSQGRHLEIKNQSFGFWNLAWKIIHTLKTIFESIEREVVNVFFGNFSKLYHMTDSIWPTKIC